jgi:hypothetical protein
MSDHPHDHGHDHDHDAHVTNEDDDLELTEHEAKFLALKGMLIEQGILTADEIRARLESNELRTPHQAARMVAKAWVDPEYRSRVMTDAKKAALELGIPVTEAALVALENTPVLHNVVVCTLCSCYPRSLLGEPPAFYVSKAYRSRTVREPRKVLREFGLDFPDTTEIRVHDSNADLRYVVIPRRPIGSEQMSETELASLVCRDSLIGCALALDPSHAAASRLHP